MIAPVTHILPLTRIRRSRMLPGKGYVLVQAGEQVSAIDTVAEADLPGKHVLMDIRKALGIHSVDETLKSIDRKVGDKVEKGDVLAQSAGLLSRVVRAPVSGVIVAIQKGQVLLEEYGQKIEVKAGLNGVVSEVLPERGVVIEGNGALVQGVWGNQRTNIGLLLRQAEKPDEELTRANLNVSFRGAIVLAGCIGKADTLDAAQELPVKGLILASMAAHLVPMAMKVEYPIILIEGFGRIPMNSRAFNLLSANQQRDIALNSSWDSSLGSRPEVFIPLPADGNPILDAGEFLPGKTVRIHSAPFSGAIGTIVFIHPGQTAFANGLRAQAAEIRLENAQMVTVPFANLDVLE